MESAKCVCTTCVRSAFGAAGAIQVFVQAVDEEEAPNWWGFFLVGDFLSRSQKHRSRNGSIQVDTSSKERSCVQTSFYFQETIAAQQALW